MKFKTKVSILFLTLFIGAGVLGANVAPAEAASLAELQQYIEQLKTQIMELQAKLKLAQQGITEPAEWCHTFNKNLKYGDTGAEVSALQTALGFEGFQGLTSNVRGNFGQFTASAVVGFQEKYAKEILSQYGLSHGTGFVGKTTRAKLNQLYGCGVTPVRCTDTDGGKNYYVKGIAETKIGSGGAELTDSCCSDENDFICGKPAGSILNEAYCRNNTTVDSVRYICPNGCVNGACKREIGENLPPVIDGLTAPTQLKVNEKGVWTIKARDPENGVLSYSVNWGDEYGIKPLLESAPAGLDARAQTTTFTHSYNTAGIYTIRFTVTDDHRQTAKTSVSVKVIGSVTTCTDSDGGINKYVKGTACRQVYYDVSGSSDAGMFCRTDICVASPSNVSPLKGSVNNFTAENYVKEYYCRNGKIFSKTIYCENGCANGACVIEEEEPTPSITVTYPNGGETWVVGDTYDIIWESTGVDKVVIAFCVELSTGGMSCYNIAETYGGVDAELKKCSWWLDPSNRYFQAFDKFKIKIRDASDYSMSSTHDFSDDYFSIISATTCSSLQNQTTCLDNSGCYWDQQYDNCRTYNSTKQTCSDPDNGKDIYTQAHTYGFREAYANERDKRIRTGGKDACIGDKLREHYCSNDYYIKSYDTECPNGCENGACVKGDEPYCSSIGTRSEGWYQLQISDLKVRRDQSSDLIGYENCDGCFAECKKINTDAEGWYSSCDDKLIKYENCGDDTTPSITVTSPNGGGQWVVGETYEIKWTSQGIDKIVIHVTDYSYSSECPLTIVKETEASRESYFWTIPQDFFSKYPDWKPGDDFKVFIAGLKPDGSYYLGKGQDESDNYFSIVEKLCGDVNCDGVVNYGDEILLHNYIDDPSQFSICSEWAADVTCDNQIDMSDVDLLRNHTINNDLLWCCED